MSTPEARRSPRVAYHAAVELVAPTDDEHDTPRTLSAAALDLGPGGMRVAVAERVPIGAPLTCRLTLDGRSTALAGRVVWMRSHTSPTPHGMGIRFDELSGRDQRLLADVVQRSSSGYRPVQLQFEGTSAPIVARALPHATGFTLSAPLPILDRGAGVEVQFDAEARALHGRIDEVRVVELDRRRRLEVEITLGDAERARFRREARFVSAQDLPPVQRPSEAATQPPTPSVAAPVRGPSATPRVLLSLAVGVAAGLLLAARLPAAMLGPRSEVPGNGRPVASTVGSPAPPPPSPAPAEPKDRQPRSPTPPAAAGALPSPSVSIDGQATLLRLPFTGSLEGMVARTWAEPAALALDLPGGHVELAPGSYQLRGGSIAGLRVNARGGASLLRVRLATPIARYAVSAHEGVLELRVFGSQ